MKKILALILIAVFCFQFTTTFAEEPAPNPDYIKENQIFVGSDKFKNEVYSLEGINPDCEYSGLITISEFHAECDHRKIRIAKEFIRTVDGKEYLAVNFRVDEDTAYGFRLFTTVDGERYMLLDTFVSFCKIFFGPDYEYVPYEE